MSLGSLKQLKNIKGLWFIIIAVVAGVALILIGSINNKPNEKVPVETDAKNYTNEIELKLKNMLESIEGVSDVTVMLTYDSGSEYVYAQNHDDADSREYVIVRETSNAEKLQLVKEINPKIRGVAIVCIGGNDPQIQSRIIKLLSTLFNLSSNRVYVTG